MLILAIVHVRISGKITTVPRLFSEHLHQMKNKHQIMNVHIQWDCLIPILSLKQVILDQTGQNGYQTVPLDVYIHNLMVVFHLV